MKCIVRIPLEPWCIRFIVYQNAHKLDSDGITIHQSAKDLLGKIVTGYMRKTIFDQWYMAIPSQPHIRIALPPSYNKYGLTKEDTENISSILEQFAKKELCFQVAVYASEPGVSRANVIRKVFNHYGITDDDYDLGHFRRYFDRYSKDALGRDFLDFRAEITPTLKQIYAPIIKKYGFNNQ
jgi:hypothetical protein